MRPEAAEVLASSLDTSGARVQLVVADVAPTLIRANAFVPGMRRPRLGAAEADAMALAAAAVDLRWRIDVVRGADRVADDLGRVRANVPDRRLDHVMLTVDELVHLLRTGTPGERLAALGEAALRAEREPDVAAALHRGLGARVLVELMAMVAAESADGDLSPSIALAVITIAVHASGDQGAITVAGEALTGFHFRQQDRMLDMIARSFSRLDVAAHGGSPDGVVSIDDLRAAAAWPDPVAEAATWLLAHPQVLEWVTLGEDLRDYLSESPARPHAHEHRLDRFELDDIAAYRLRRNAAFTVWPLLSSIDVAVQGDPGMADGFVSRDDLVAALGWQISDHQRAAIAQLLADEVYDVASHADLLLTALSLAPVIGDGVDLAAAAVFTMRGDLNRAGQHLIGVVPLPGVSGTTVRTAIQSLGRRTARLGAETAVNAVDWVVKTPARDRLAPSPSLRRRPAIIGPVRSPSD